MNVGHISSGPSTISGDTYSGLTGQDALDTVYVGDQRFYSILNLQINNNDKDKTDLKDMGTIFNDLAHTYVAARDIFKGKTSARTPQRREHAEKAKRCDEVVNAFSIATHPSALIFDLADRVDVLAANGEYCMREMLWLKPTCRKTHTKQLVIPHGLKLSTPISGKCVMEKKQNAKREILQRLSQASGITVSGKNKSNGHFDVSGLHCFKHYIFLKISRPVLCKAFDRDVVVCRILNNLLLKNHERGVFIVVSYWDANKEENVIKDWISCARNENLRNIDFFFLNEFDWPGEARDNEWGSSRDCLLWATDVSFSQSRYESFGLAQIEPLQYGVICIMSGVSGACLLLREAAVDGIEEEYSPVIVADYMISNESIGSLKNMSDNATLRAFCHNWEKDEEYTSVGIAAKVYAKLKSGRPNLFYKNGWRITKECFELESASQKFLDAIGLRA